MINDTLKQVELQFFFFSWIFFKIALKIQQKLNELRMKGGEYKITQNKIKKIIEISEDGKIVLCDIQYTQSPNVPTDMSNYPYFRFIFFRYITNFIYLFL